MHIKQLSINEFTEFQKNHALSTYFQTVNYGILMAENTHDYELIGYVDDDNNIYAASLIIIKNLGKKFYGYAPRGFLIDYSNEALLTKFTNDLKDYYAKKNLIFIKINPEIAVAEIDVKNNNSVYNINTHINNIMINAGYKKLKDNLYFESMIPRFNAFIKTKDFNIESLDKNTKNKIKKGIRKGLVFEKVEKEKLNILYNFIKNKKEKDIYYYNDYYTVFNKDQMIDLFLVKIDYKEFLINCQQAYEKELEKNNHYNELLMKSNNPKLINKKMNSDKTILSYKNDILEASKGLQDNIETYIAGALVVKHNNKAYIVMSGYDLNYKRFAPNYFLHYSIIKHYLNEFEFIDLNGLTGDFSSENPYKGLNNFKLGFNPKVYEFIGEFDLVIDEFAYNQALRKGLLAKEFNKQ